MLQFYVIFCRTQLPVLEAYSRLPRVHWFSWQVTIDVHLNFFSSFYMMFNGFFIDFSIAFSTKVPCLDQEICEGRKGSLKVFLLCYKKSWKNLRNQKNWNF